MSTKRVACPLRSWPWLGFLPEESHLFPERPCHWDWMIYRATNGRMIKGYFLWIIKGIIRLVIDKWIDDALMTQWPEMMIQCSSSPMGSLGLQVERFLKWTGNRTQTFNVGNLPKSLSRAIPWFLVSRGKIPENHVWFHVIPANVIVSFGRASHWAGVEDFGVRDDLLRRLKHETAQAVASTLVYVQIGDPLNPKPVVDRFIIVYCNLSLYSQMARSCSSFSTATCFLWGKYRRDAVDPERSGKSDFFDKSNRDAVALRRC